MEEYDSVEDTQEAELHHLEGRRCEGTEAPPRQGPSGVVSEIGNVDKEVEWLTSSSIVLLLKGKIDPFESGHSFRAVELLEQSLKIVERGGDENRIASAVG